MWKASKVNIHHVTANKIRTWAAFGSKRPKMALSSTSPLASDNDSKKVVKHVPEVTGECESQVNVDHVTAKNSPY